MKRYKLFILALPFFLSILLSGCGGQEDDFAVPESRLTLKVTSDHYLPASARGTRMTEQGYATRFISGDAIGVLQITPSSGNGEKATCKNYRFILDGEGNWTGTSLLHRQGDEYIVYYPYAPVEDEAALETYIASFQPRLNQSVYEDYTQSDLMKGEGLVSGNTLNVNFNHLMTLIVIELPLGKCTTTKDGKVKYHPATTTLAPPALSWEEGKLPYQTSDGNTLRYLVKPGVAVSLKGSYPYHTGMRQFDITAAASDVIAQHYLLYALDEGVEPPGVRDVQVGDYYMSDGTIFPAAAASVPEGCIGIVYQVNPSRMSTDEIAQGWSHGCVMALTNAGTNAKWGKGATEGTGENSPFAGHAATYKEMYEETEGYVTTKYIWDTYGSDETFPEVNGAFYQACQYGETAETAPYKAPAGSSGWYLPSIGQWWDILENLGKAEGLAALREDETAISTSKTYGFELKNEFVLENLNSCLTAASPLAESFTSSINYWSSSEHNRNYKGLVYAHAVSFTATSITSTGATKTSNSKRGTRCVLSF